MRGVEGKAWIVVGQDIDRDVGLDRQHALVDRGGGVRAGDGGADQLARRAVDDDRHVAELGLDRVAAGARREVGDELERVEAGVRACSTVTPTKAASGSVYVARGSAR